MPTKVVRKRHWARMSHGCPPIVRRRVAGRIPTHGRRPIAGGDSITGTGSDRAVEPGNVRPISSLARVLSCCAILKARPRSGRRVRPVPVGNAGPDSNPVVSAGFQLRLAVAFGIGDRFREDADLAVLVVAAIEQARRREVP